MRRRQLTFTCIPGFPYLHLPFLQCSIIFWHVSHLQIVAGRHVTRFSFLQVSNLQAGAEGASATMLETARAIVQKHGWRGVFRGVSINYIKVTPATAVGFTVYDQMKVLLGLENHL